MTRLSVNINKLALIRNSRSGNLPDILKLARDCESFGAEGITVHPRPDQRHIRFDDIPKLKSIVTTEFNIEGNPTPEFMKLVLENQPDQCTLVPDAPEALTSDSGWDTIKHSSFLKEIIKELKNNNIRVSLFLDPVENLVEGAKETGADRIEFYTGKYASQYAANKIMAVEKHVVCAKLGFEIGLGINAGHDLNLDNLKYYKDHVIPLHEVSIGHAIICDAFYYGLHNTIQLYKK
ncbi:MAG TPA: pyridoxine 5'-phosphate synthase, partial [Saprospiraceae bacterium]|nr:pyridoxine 5'-phosphate synthase [Saprospiraceae bacterium]